MRSLHCGRDDRVGYMEFLLQREILGGSFDALRYLGAAARFFLKTVHWTVFRAEKTSG